MLFTKNEIDVEKVTFKIKETIFEVDESPYGNKRLFKLS
jgi:hypothetical protein